MKIAIDIDGVILDTENLFCVYAELYNIEIGKREIRDNSKSASEGKYNWTIEELERYWEKYIVKATKEAGLMKGAGIIIPKLKEEGHILIINTARGVDDGITKPELNAQIIESAKEEFKKANLEFDKYYWGVADKSIPCIEENVDIMIEDNYKNCINIASKKIHVLYFRNAESKKIDNNKYIHEVHNWGEIYVFIREFSKNK